MQQNINYHEKLFNIVNNVERVIIGKREVINLLICAFLCKGHVLIEDVPGVGKTSLASALAKSFSCSFKRIQFTPDVLPSDITGFSMYNQKSGEFEYKEGAIMSNIVLADEINRASPKTQSSLLEVMEENQVTVDGVTYPLEKPFIVLATQNPVEYLGTYPLPEAQMDRFFMRIFVGYPKQEDESQMLLRFKGANPLETLSAVMSTQDLITLQNLVSEIFVSNEVSDYIVNLVRRTRENPNVILGGSPRASLALFKAAQAHAFLNKRNFANPDDVKKMILPTLEHRIFLKPEAKIKNITQNSIVLDALKSVKVPV